MTTKIKNLLTEGEEVLVDARIHSIIFGPSIVYLTVALLVGLFFHWLVGLTIVFLSIYPLYNAYIHYKMTHLVLTNKKVLSREGFLSRDWIKMPFERIENSYLEEPIIGRHFGYSTVVVSGVGSGSIAVPYVRNGDIFVRELEEELEKNRKISRPK